jgi:hypothetical protein
LWIALVLACTIRGLSVFDAEYVFRGEPTEDAIKTFDVSRKGAIQSGGGTVWYGFKRTPWKDYAAELTTFARDLQLIQTDLCCVNREYLAPFLNALPLLK